MLSVRIRCLVLFLLSVMSLSSTSGCSTVPVNPIQPPSSTTKLRVYVQPISAENAGGNKPFGKRGMWKGVSNDEFKDKQMEIVRDYLEDMGYYEVVSPQEVRAAIGDEEQNLTRSRMEAASWSLAKRIGKAVYADYVMVMERARQADTLGAREFVFRNVLINVENGKTFDASFRMSRAGGADFRDRRRGIRATYRMIFHKAKEDMLATAMLKAGRADGFGPGESRQDAKPAAQATATKPDSAPNPDWADEINGDEGLIQPVSVAGKSPKLVVYDLEASAQYKPAALIITEALREELYLQKRFTLVNRENLEQILKEMALQQTGLIDEKEAVKTGKGLAANQVVTGQIGLLGKTFVLQAKRIDVERLATLGMSSARFQAGREDAVFQELPEFAKQLSGL